MLRSELIDIMLEENPHLTRRDIERVVAVFLETITQTLERGARVELRGFGAFSALPGLSPPPDLGGRKSSPFLLLASNVG